MDATRGQKRASQERATGELLHPHFTGYQRINRVLKALKRGTNGCVLENGKFKGIER